MVSKDLLAYENNQHSCSHKYKMVYFCILHRITLRLCRVATLGRVTTLPGAGGGRDTDSVRHTCHKAMYCVVLCLSCIAADQFRIVVPVDRVMLELAIETSRVIPC